MTQQFDPTIGPVVTVGIGAPGSAKLIRSPGGIGKVITCWALIDTGASVTCISPSVAQNAGLRPIGKISMATFSGTHAANNYLADVFFPFGVPSPGTSVPTPVLVSENTQLVEFQAGTPHYECLLGRDVLYLGLFQMVGYARNLTICA